MNALKILIITFAIVASPASLAMSDLAAEAYEKMRQGDFAAARTLLNQGSAKTDRDALFLLGMLYDSGNGVDSSQERAAELYLKAAELGQPIAQLYISVFYMEGIAVQKDMDKAVHWLTRSAQSGNVEAQTRLGLILSAGELADHEEAIHWLRMAAYQKDTRAMGSLATLLMRNHENLPEAYAWSHLAAKYDPVQFQTSTRELISGYCTPKQVEAGMVLMRDIEEGWSK